MYSNTSALVQLMMHKKWIDMGVYTILQSPAYKDRQDIVKNVLYWLNHIHIVDQIFTLHMRNEPSHFTSTESSIFASLPELHKAAESLDQWLIEYAQTMDDMTANEKINFTFTDGNKGCMSRLQMLIHLSSHGLYHISVITQELASQALPIPPLLFTTYSSKIQKEEINT